MLGNEQKGAFHELDSSHVPMLSQPERVLDVIRTAASSYKSAGKKSDRLGL